jgi:phospholipid/cholesterol/gamma-HCH transport system permease protein
LREFGVVLTGIVLAGRTNSSFTAQIGTMKMRQEIDAMQTLGLKPMEVLVAPRVLAMVVMTPILAFVSTMAGIAGGIVVGWTSLDINPGLFIERLRNSVPLDQFWIGMSKAPVFGLVVALIACRQGLLTGGSVQSLGHRTTTSVVQAIFAIIVLDALFAIFYMELGI